MKIPPAPAPRRNRGIALLMLLFIVLAFASTWLVSALSKTNVENQRQKRTVAALAQAKEALIAWSVWQGSEPDLGKPIKPRPGSLPCPAEVFGNAKNSCAQGAGTTLGRLPWQELGIDDLRDADGESLWYVLSNSFRKQNLHQYAINSDSLGDLQLYAPDGNQLLGGDLVALVFAPGPPLSGQERGVNSNEASHFLERIASNRNNALASGPFVSGPVKTLDGNVQLNDRVIGISAQELIAAIEKRVLKEASNALEEYWGENGKKYPNPGKINDAVCLRRNAESKLGNPELCQSDTTRCFGRLPENELAPHLSIWFRQNAWGRALFYAVNKDHVQTPGEECSSSLSVDGQIKPYVLIAPGVKRSTQMRPSITLSDYLEDPENNQAWGPSPSASFITPKAGNDQLWAPQ